MPNMTTPSCFPSNRFTAWLYLNLNALGTRQNSDSFTSNTLQFIGLLITVTNLENCGEKSKKFTSCIPHSHGYANDFRLLRRYKFVFNCHLANARQKPPKDRTKTAREFNKSADLYLLRRPWESVFEFNFRLALAQRNFLKVALHIHNSFSLGLPIDTLG